MLAGGRRLMREGRCLWVVGKELLCHGRLVIQCVTPDHAADGGRLWL